MIAPRNIVLLAKTRLSNLQNIIGHQQMDVAAAKEGLKKAEGLLEASLAEANELKEWIDANTEAEATM